MGLRGRKRATCCAVQPLSVVLTMAAAPISSAMAHLAASGGLATSGAIYSFQRGPDGQSYAVGGEVHIDVSPGRTPQETVTRAQTVIAAALAPADPSGQDRAVAAQARQIYSWWSCGSAPTWQPT